MNSGYMQKIALMLIAIMACSIAEAAEEDEVLNLEGMSVIGNQELPKSLMVIPWKHSELGELLGHSMDSLLDTGLRPVDHDVFKRKLEYYRLRSE